MFGTFKFHINPFNFVLALHNISCNLYPFFPKKKKEDILSSNQKIDLIFIYLVNEPISIINILSNQLQVKFVTLGSSIEKCKM